MFEAALTPLFNWRVFLARFEGRGFKTPITVLLAFIVFWSYDLDVVSSLLQALGYPQATPSLGGRILSALLIAGGSDGIVNIYTKLGIRNPVDRERRTVEAQADRAETLADEARAKSKKLADTAAAPAPPIANG